MRWGKIESEPVYIQDHFLQRGVLKKGDDFIYVALDEEYVKDLVGLISEEGFVAPPYFGELYDTGAHISVVYPGESKYRGSPDFSEIGEWVDFEVKECQIWDTPNWEGIEQIWVVLVRAPFLEHLRKKYGFRPGFEFHITIGVKPKPAEAA